METRSFAMATVFAVACLVVAFGVRFAMAPSLEDMVGQMVMTGFRGLDGAEILDDVRAGRIGGVILFDKEHGSGDPRNVDSVGQVADMAARLQAAAPVKLFVAVDQEGGTVRRLRPEHGFPDAPSPEDMGGETPQKTEATAYALGQALRAAGINVDFAPSVDLASNPDNPIIAARGRAFSADPEEAADHAGAFARGLSRAKVLYAYKHFPGHGSSSQDSHLGLPDITNTWNEDELIPYRKLLRHGLPGMVMVGHLYNRALDPDRPSSLSPKIVGGMLRRDLKWDGVVVTDDLQMRAILDRFPLDEAVRLAVEAGADVILVGNNIHYEPDMARRIHALIVRHVRDGAIARRRIQESYRRIMKLKKLI